MKKIAIIVQRFGRQINGGAEVHARMIAEKLNEKYDLTVLTSRAVDYHTWNPELPEGESIENGIRIKRFNHPSKGDWRKLHYFNRKYRGRHIPQKIHKWLGKPKWYLLLFPNIAMRESDYLKWLELQGPYMPGMITYLTENENIYDAYIFFTYLYYPTAIGIMKVPNKSILIPTMHDEPPAYYEIFKKIMSSARIIFFNTKSEKEFSEKLFPIQKNIKEIVAVGIEKPDDTIDPLVLNKFGINKKFIIYVGRVDAAKGCDVLVKFFKKYKNEVNNDIILVLVGKSTLKEKSSDSIIFTGFITDEEKQQLIKQSLALVIPSLYESLSLVLLESFACKIPVIANGHCEVLKDHINSSDGGWNYFSYEDFKKIIDLVLSNELLTREMGANGFRYAISNYSWQRVLEKFDNAINILSTPKENK